MKSLYLNATILFQINIQHEVVAQIKDQSTGSEPILDIQTSQIH
jgi:hypothetical protein